MIIISILVHQKCTKSIACVSLFHQQLILFLLLKIKRKKKKRKKPKFDKNITTINTNWTVWVLWSQKIYSHSFTRQYVTWNQCCWAAFFVFFEKWKHKCLYYQRIKDCWLKKLNTSAMHNNKKLFYEWSIKAITLVQIVNHLQISGYNFDSSSSCLCLLSQILYNK